MSIYSEILDTVWDNGRVSSNPEEFEASLIGEIEFEASERGLDAEEIQEAVKFALAHASL